MRPIEPSLEDVFISVLAEKEEESLTQRREGAKEDGEM